MESNPYAPPLAEIQPDSGLTEAERIRQEHIKVERTVKSVGLLYYIGAFFLLLIGLGQLASGFTGNAEALGMGLGFLVVGLFQGVTAYGLRRLLPWSRYLGMVVAGIGLLGFPVGTVVSIAILVSLIGRKASMVFSPHYQQIIAETPHVKYKTPRVIWWLLGILVLLVIAAVVSSLVLG